MALFFSTGDETARERSSVCIVGIAVMMVSDPTSGWMIRRIDGLEGLSEMKKAIFEYKPVPRYELALGGRRAKLVVYPE